MRILAINTGSSSLKFRLFEFLPEAKTIVSGTVTEFGTHARYDWIRAGKPLRETLPAADHAAAAREVLSSIAREGLLDDLDGIGHRIVHGGEHFAAPVRVTDRELAKLDALSALAPLHNPPALSAMRVCRERLAEVPMVAVFDTAFFHDLPEPAKVYALPPEWRRGTHRFGFHGIAHRYLAERCREQTGACRIITLQLGNGCSMAAIANGRPLDTSMGFTPLEGLIMATRGGDIDPGLLLHLIQHGLTTSELTEGLNRRSGLLGLSGASADMRELLALEERGHSGAKLAIATFCQRVRKYIGAYAAVLGGPQALVFGGGIGEHSQSIRARICANMEWCGLGLDSSINAATVGTEANISARGSQVDVFVIPVNEESLIARQTRDTL
jgi:acetate kinase